jgi:hypothetical protein
MWSLVLFFIVFVGDLGRLDAIRCNGTNMNVKPSEKLYIIAKCKSEILRDEDTSFEGVVYIGAENNLIKALDNETFRDGESLTHIDLRFNQIETIQVQVGTFDKTKKLTNLYLRNNKITNLKPGVFRGLVSLKVLWLQANQIRILENGLFEDQKYFDNLFFDDNKIVGIGSTAFPSNIKIASFNFEGNICMTINSDNKDPFIIDHNCNKFYEANKNGLEEIEGLKKALSIKINIIEKEFDKYKKKEKERFEIHQKSQKNLNNILQIVMIFEICGFAIFLIICFLLARELNNFYQNMT